MKWYFIIGISLNALSFIAVLVLCVKYVRLKNTKESEFFTDYTHGKTVLRVFKNEFEYNAFKDLKESQVLDSGTLTASYRWVLFEM